MPTADQFTIASSPVLTFLVWLFVAMVAAYFARTPAHALIWTVCRSVRVAARALTGYCRGCARAVQGWWVELLLRQTRDDISRDLRDEFQALSQRVDNELDWLPVIRERLTGQLVALEEDFHRSAEVPPEPPGWSRVTESVSQLGEEHSGAVARALEDIRDTLAHYRADAREAQRRQHHRRYLLLYRMMPRWRRVQRVLEGLDARIARLDSRLRSMRQRLAVYRRMRDPTRRNIAVLAATSSGQLVLGALLLSAVVLGVMVLSTLVALPMQEMMGSEPLVWEMPAWMVTTILLVSFQLLVGVMMLDSQRVSRVFLAIGNLDRSARQAIFWSCFLLLLMLSVTGALLHYWLSISGLAIPPMAGTEAGHMALMAILSQAAQAIMVLVLPFALAFGAIPLGMVGRSIRPVLLMLVLGLLQLLVVVGRALTVAAMLAARLLLRLYDLFIFLPLWTEARWADYRRARLHVRPAPAHSGQLPAPAAAGFRRPVAKQQMRDAIE